MGRCRVWSDLAGPTHRCRTAAAGTWLLSNTRSSFRFSGELNREIETYKLPTDREKNFMEKMGAASDSDIEDLFQSKKRVKNPLVPIGALLTAGVLTAGLISFRQGNAQLGQKLMRARVVAQGATVALMVGSAYYYGENFWDKKADK